MDLEVKMDVENSRVLDSKPDLMEFTAVSICIKNIGVIEASIKLKYIDFYFHT